VDVMDDKYPATRKQVLMYLWQDKALEEHNVNIFREGCNWCMSVARRGKGNLVKALNIRRLDAYSFGGWKRAALHLITDLNTKKERG